jgi:Flp pilus assembly pilin Flp
MGVLTRRFLRSEGGAAAYEFTLIAALVSAAILASVIALGVKLDTAHERLAGIAASPA